MTRAEPAAFLAPDLPGVSVIRRRSEPHRRRRLVELLADLLDKPEQSGGTSER